MSETLKADPIFSDRFEFPEGVTHARCVKPEGALSPRKHMEMSLPGDFGRATLDIYIRGGVEMYSRLVAMRTGEVAWFTVDYSAPTSSPEPRP